tara:strand:+ start:26895 stop:27368 length:474 start_codon:yes stop_codon:yes gene_type:complete
MGRLFLLFIGIPLVELWLLVEIGQVFGGVVTIGLVILTGAVGVTLARQQGISTIARLRHDVVAGRFPADSLVDGLMILLAAVVLITPGVLTDFVGFLFLIPSFRGFVKHLVRRNLERMMHDPTSRVTVMYSGQSSGSGAGREKNVTPKKSERSLDSD